MNEALTLRELREMDGEPVRVESGVRSSWMLVCTPVNVPWIREDDFLVGTSTELFSGAELLKTGARFYRRPAGPPNGTPLTLRELQKMDGEPVYIVTRNRGSGWCVVHWHGSGQNHWLHYSRTGTAEGARAEMVNGDEYGKSWRAYREKEEV